MFLYIFIILFIQMANISLYTQSFANAVNCYIHTYTLITNFSFWSEWMIFWQKIEVTKWWKENKLNKFFWANALKFGKRVKIPLFFLFFLQILPKMKISQVFRPQKIPPKFPPVGKPTSYSSYLHVVRGQVSLWKFLHWHCRYTTQCTRIFPVLHQVLNHTVCSPRELGTWNKFIFFRTWHLTFAQKTRAAQLRPGEPEPTLVFSSRFEADTRRPAIFLICAVFEKHCRSSFSTEDSLGGKSASPRREAKLNFSSSCDDGGQRVL